MDITDYKTEIINTLLKFDKSIKINTSSKGFDCIINTPIGKMYLTLECSDKSMFLFRVFPESTLEQFNDVFAEKQIGAVNPHSLKWNVSTLEGDFKFILFCVTTMINQIEEYIEDN